ncbi:NADP-dependent glyceraldehyde-3-phosphate dehydrogenase [Ureaplasma urealyticum]|uniref:NADP-dependent glyceraldehyde-3-phosphate dehydrogenase n=1 Tax=Ureaplasma urealyticum TaxID=2130 RepID=UPI000302FE05|nr:NADP-dependent glyceraldehyde-3-phosphate dehydrogenase [Ureaplasma urealyticum]
MNYKTLINGAFVDVKEKLAVYNPSNNQIIAYVPNIHDENEINTIFENAHKAYLKFKDTTIEYRCDLLLKLADKLDKHKQELAQIISSEIAKGLKDSLAEVERSVDYLRETVVEYQKLMQKPIVFDETIHHIKNKIATYYRIPVGVVLAICPFNYPINLLISKLAPALVSGNSLVYKPSTQGSLIGIRIGELVHEVGFPKGVVNCLTTEARVTGDILVTNKYVKAISFTGGPKVGNHIAEITSKISLVLELGGKDPALVLDDADLELAANEIVKGAYGFSGQRCTAIKRVFVSQKNHDQLVNLINKKVSALTIGLPEQSPVITPLISTNSLKYNLSLVDDAIKKGALVHQPIIFDEKSNLLHPLVIDNVTKDMYVAWEEPFGPILPIIVYQDIKEAISLINQSQYGLQACIFTTNYDHIETLALQIEAGTININKSSSRGPDILPFFGVKDSGFGIQGIVDAILSMTTIKGVIVNK